MKEHPDIMQFDSFATKAGGYEPIFNRNYTAAYELFSVEFLHAVSRLQKPLKALDIGCGDGWTAAFLASISSGTYVGIDASGESVKALAVRMQGDRRLKTYGLHQSADWLLTGPAIMQLQGLLGGLPSLIICNGVIHQLRKTSCDVAQIVYGCAEMLEIGGCFVAGDYYYPAYLSKEELNSAHQWIRETTGQNPTARDVFLSLDDFRQILHKTDLQVSVCRETKANISIPLYYYVITAWRKM
jgi:SAM-dependent methyltransferase